MPSYGWVARRAQMKVGGLASIANAFLLGAPAYGQTKFNVLNFGFTRRTDSALAAYVCAFFCGALFLAGYPLINHLPRFLLAALLIFSGAGFLIEKLYDARKAFSAFEFASIWAVFITNIVAGAFLPQVTAQPIRMLAVAMQNPTRAIDTHSLARTVWHAQFGTHT